MLARASRMCDFFSFPSHCRIWESDSVNQSYPVLFSPHFLTITSPPKLNQQHSITNSYSSSSHTIAFADNSSNILCSSGLSCNPSCCDSSLHLHFLLSPAHNHQITNQHHTTSHTRTVPPSKHQQHSQASPNPLQLSQTTNSPATSSQPPACNCFSFSLLHIAAKESAPPQHTTTCSYHHCTHTATEQNSSNSNILHANNHSKWKLNKTQVPEPSPELKRTICSLQFTLSFFF